MGRARKRVPRHRKRCSGEGCTVRAPGSRGHPHVAQNLHSGSIIELHSAHGTGTRHLPHDGQKRTGRSLGSGVRHPGHAAARFGAAASGAGAEAGAAPASTGTGRGRGIGGAAALAVTSGAKGFRYTPTLA